MVLRTHVWEEAYPFVSEVISESRLRTFHFELDGIHHSWFRLINRHRDTLERLSLPRWTITRDSFHLLVSRFTSLKELAVARDETLDVRPFTTPHCLRHIQLLLQIFTLPDNASLDTLHLYSPPKSSPLDARSTRAFMTQRFRLFELGAAHLELGYITVMITAWKVCLVPSPPSCFWLNAYIEAHPWVGRWSHESRANGASEGTKPAPALVWSCAERQLLVPLNSQMSGRTELSLCQVAVIYYTAI